MEATTFVLGTVISLKAYGDAAQKAIKQAIEKLNEIDDKLSVFKKSSEISQINQQAGEDFQRVSCETYYLLRKTIWYSELQEGAFDPTIGPLVSLWGIGTQKAGIPDDDEIRQKLMLVNYRDILFNEKKSAVMLRRKGQAIDLGGIAKGYAADVIRNIFIRNNIQSAVINLGGNIFVIGGKMSSEPWSIGIQDPYGVRGEFVGIVKETDKSIVTSGNYERYFIHEGNRMHHIIDPRSGYPSNSQIISATIISDNSIDGDGLSTGVFILGVEKAIKLIESMKGIEAILITKGRDIYTTSGVKEEFLLTNKNYNFFNRDKRVG